MSPLWKSELLVRLGRAECRVQLRSAWRRVLVGEASAPGTCTDAAGAALSALRAQGFERLPRRARLLVPDEHTYFTLLPATPDWHRAQPQAADHFAALLGRHDLRVQVAALPGGRWWLAAAIESSELAAWRAALAAGGVTVASVEPALLHDLRTIAPHVDDDAVVALLRDEGVMLLRVRQGAPVELSWERCDTHSQHGIEQRLLAFSHHGEVERPEPVTLLCRSAVQRGEWRRLAKAHRWTLLRPKALHRTPVEAQT